MKDAIRILILDNSPIDTEKTTKYLKENNYLGEIFISQDEKSFISQLDNVPDVILSEHVIPEFNSFHALAIARQKYPNIIFILLSGEVCEEFAVELLKEGVDDYVLKNHMLRLSHSIEVAVQNRLYSEESKKLVKVNKELSIANETIELKNKSMTQSIVFAERIQHLTLPKMEVILKDFSEAFIMYKPKDIVSGDFYWFTHKNNRFMGAVADCTGHGVSGALLSMIGSGFLNEIVENEEGINHPTDILRELDANICKILHQGANGGYQDGIDIAFVSIDIENKKIFFSGCKRPLLFYKKRDKEFIEYKGEPYIIGGIDSRIVKTFNTQEISYKPGDCIYMYTDGCVDQFGGENNKKLLKERFQDILLSFKHLGLNYQGQLLEQKLIKWKGDFEQTDDMLAVGIKL